VTDFEEAALIAREARLLGAELAMMVLDLRIAPVVDRGGTNTDLFQEATALGYCAINLLVKSREIMGIISSDVPGGAAPLMPIFMAYAEKEFHRAGIPVKISIVEEEKKK
jgi:hypothetical protein